MPTPLLGILASAPAFAPSRRPASPSSIEAPRRPADPISAVMIAKDAGRRLAEVLSALAWCDEVVILDTGSSDRTQEIAEGFANVRFHRLEGRFPGFGAARFRAVSLARNDWILSVDADEVVSERLASEIAALPLDRRMVYSIPFENYFDGRRVTACGWSPDRHDRLFHRKSTQFCLSRVHERVRTEGLVRRRLRNPIRHYSYESLDDFLRKMRDYAGLYARQNAGRKRSGAASAVARSAWAFLRSYLLRRGFAAGRTGLVISAYQAQVVFWKHLMLDEANRGRR